MQNKRLALLLLDNFNMLESMVKKITGTKGSKKSLLTSKQFFTLEKMKQYEKIELKYLSKELYVSTSSLCILLNKMVENEYVFRAEDPKDRRNTLYGLTKYGKKILALEEDMVVNSLSESLDSIDQELKNRLEESLKTLTEVANKL